MKSYTVGGGPIHTACGDKTIIIYDVSDEVKALIKAARALDYVLDLFDICEEGTGAEQYYEMRRALAACKDIPCE